METKTIFVWATDKFLSGWGCASHKIHKQIIVCNGWGEADKIINGLEKDGTFKFVNWGYEKPYFTPSKYTTTTRPATDFTRFL